MAVESRDFSPEPNNRVYLPLTEHVYRLAGSRESATLLDVLSQQSDPVDLSTLRREFNDITAVHKLSPSSVLFRIISEFEIFGLLERTRVGDKQFTYALTECGRNIHAILAPTSLQIQTEMRRQLYQNHESDFEEK